MTDTLAGFMSDLAIACADFYNLDSASRSYAATQQDGILEEMNDSYGVLLAAVLESKQSVAKALSSAEVFMNATPKDSEAFGTVQSCYGLLNDWRMRVGSLDSNLKSIALDVSANYVDLMARSRANNPFTAPVVTPDTGSEALIGDDDEPLRVIPRDVDPGDSVYIIPQDGKYEDHQAFEEPSEEEDDEEEIYVTQDPRSTHTGDDPKKGDDVSPEKKGDEEEIYVTQDPRSTHTGDDPKEDDDVSPEKKGDNEEIYVTQDPRSTHTGDDPKEDDDVSPEKKGDDEEIYVTQEEPLEYGTLERDVPVQQNTMSPEMASEIRSIVLGTMVEYMEANAPRHGQVEEEYEEDDEEEVPEPVQPRKKGGFLVSKSTRAKRKGGDQ